MKITKSTFKSFVKKNIGNLFIKVTSKFDGMIDGHNCNINAKFDIAKMSEFPSENNLGYSDIYLVGSSKNYFTEYNDGQFKGIECANCCCTFVIAIKC